MPIPSFHHENWPPPAVHERGGPSTSRPRIEGAGLASHRHVIWGRGKTVEATDVT